MQRDWKLWWERGIRDPRDAENNGNDSWNAENGEDMKNQDFSSDEKFMFEMIRKDITEIWVSGIGFIII